MTQLNADPSMRGRIVSVHLLVLLGGTPIGAPLVGLVSDTLGARFSLIPGGAISALAAVGLSAVITACSRTTRRAPRSQAVFSALPRVPGAGGVKPGSNGHVLFARHSGG
ncbi:hypothetical protein AB0C13_26650 [Streptomyces sp. NPDC049099]|uniref:hypothetical protein n=1 Tax=Streptomyces sp. NPDC049099 TaxID=3155768 RepID=UPI003446256A